MDDYRNGAQPIYGLLGIVYTDPGLPEAQQAAWNNLNSTEREDLEQLIIIAMSRGGGAVAEIFNQMSRYAELEYAKKKVDKRRDKVDNWLRHILPWRQEEYEKLGQIQSALRSKLEGNIGLRKKLIEGALYLEQQSNDIIDAYTLYQASNDRIAALEGNSDKGVSWETIELA